MKTNTQQSVSRIYTHEGAIAVHINPIEQLRRSVMANMLWEGSFYEDGVSVATRIQETATEILSQKDGAQKIADIAYEARTQFKLRHVPLLLIVSLIRANTENARAVVADTIARVVQRPDELGELVSLYWAGKRSMIPNQMKRGLGMALGKFREYSLAKYDNDSAAVKIRDVLFLSHATPKDDEQAELWKRLVARELKTPDTWEVALSSGANKTETFSRLLAEEKLGALALLRNLRNMQQAGVNIAAIRTGIATMKTERVLPFRFITAARYAPQLEPELETAMFGCVADHAKLGGKTVLVVDNSGSMPTPVSGKSELTRSDAACAVAMLLREVCEDVRVIVFGNTAGLVRPLRGFALRDEIVRSNHSGGTDTERALHLATAEGYDRCIVITDEQSRTSIGGPIRGTKAYFVNVAANQNGIGYGAWVHIDGWSESIIDYIVQYEKEKEK